MTLTSGGGSAANQSPAWDGAPSVRRIKAMLRRLDLTRLVTTRVNAGHTITTGGTDPTSKAPGIRGTLDRHELCATSRTCPRRFEPRTALDPLDVSAVLTWPALPVTSPTASSPFHRGGSLILSSRPVPSLVAWATGALVRLRARERAHRVAGFPSSSSSRAEVLRVARSS